MATNPLLNAIAEYNKSYNTNIQQGGSVASFPAPTQSKPTTTNNALLSAVAGYDQSFGTNISGINNQDNLQSNLRVTPDKWSSTTNAYKAYANNHSSPDFVYDENVNRNQYNSVKSLMDDIDADVASYRQQGNNIDADGLLYNKDQLQEILNALDKEYNDNKAPETAAFQGIDNSIQKTLGSASEYSQQASDLESQIAELERTNHRGVIRQDTDAVSGEQYDVYGNVNDEALHQLREQLQNTNANKAAAERAEQREALKGNADYAERSAANSPLAENLEAQRLIGGRATDAVSGQEYTEQSAIDLLGYASDDENQMFNYILNTQGEGAAKEYIDDLRYDLNARQASAKSQEKSQAALEHEGAESLKSVGQNLISGAGLFDTAIQNVYRDITGNNRRIDYNTWANQQSQQVQATRGTVAQELTDKYGTKRILGKDVSWGDAYQLGMSMLDSGATAALGGVTGLGGGTAALLGASAGTQAMQEAVKDGASDSQALMLGFAAMAAETITEKVSLDNLLSAPGKNILTNALRQAGIEASEEAASTVLNELANETVMGEDSDFNKRVREYEANGMSHEEAQQQAWKQFGSQLLWDAIGGAISGGIMGGMAKSINGDTNTDTNTQQETRAPDNELLNTLSQYDNAQIQAINRNNTNNALSQTLTDYDNQQLAELRNIQEANARAEIDRQNEAIRAGNENIRNQNAQIQEAQTEQRFANEVWDEASERAYNAPSITQFKKQNADWLKANGYSSADATNLWKSIHNDIDAHRLTEQEELALTYDSKAQFRADLVAQSDGQISYAEAGEIYDSARNKNRWNQEQQAARERTRTANENPLVNAALQEERAELDYPTNPLTRTVQNAQNASQNSPLEQTSAVEANTPLSETVLNATEAQQTASAPTVSENAENPQGPRPFDMGAVARDVWNQQTQQAEQQTRASTPFSPSYNEQGNGRKVESGLSENIRTDSARDAQIQEMFDEDPQFYKQKTNADTLANAKAMLGENFDVDPTDAVSKVRSALDDAKGGMKLKPEVVPATKLVADKLAEQAKALEAEGKTTEANAKMDTARGLLADLASELTQAGQLGQAARILRNQGPAVRSKYIHNLVDEFNKSLTKRQSEKISQKQTAEGQEATGQVKVPEELLNTFRDADTPDAQEAALHDIAAYIGKNTPSTFYQKWTNLRFTNMLGNFVTQIRNVLGNSASSLNHMVKRRINGNIENAVKNVDRSFAGRYGTSELASWWNAFKSDPQIENAAMNGGRYDTVRKLNKGAFGQDIESNQTIYGGRDPASRYLEAKRRLTNWATEQGDVVFQRLNFADAAAGYAKAHGFTFETATDAQKADAIEYAINEAQEATFHNDTALSDFVTGLHIKENSQLAKKHPGLTKVVNAFGDGLLPFRKTPANILTQAEEFSPLGLINTTVKAVQAKKGNATASDVINSFSKALTGTGVLGMGMMMRALGKARASEDDEEKAAYQKMNGEQDYAIKVGDNWLTMDWVAPDSIPFFMGVKLMDILSERDGFQTEDISQFLGGMTDTFLNMSMLQSVNDTLENLRGFGTDADAMPKLATSLAISYLTQGLGSSLAGRIESAFTPNRQDTYTDPDSPLSNDLQYAIGRLGNKILGYDYQQADYIDAWGNKQKGQGVDNPFARAGLAMFSPSYVREDTTTDFDRGLMELHDQLEGTDFKGDVLPKHISRSTVVGDKRLTPEEYEIYATNVGQMRREMAEAFWNSDLRETLSPEEQGKVITDIYEYCASRGKADILDRRGQSLNSNDDWADEVEFFGDDVNRLTKYLATKDAFKDNLSSGNYEAIDSLLKTIDSFTNTDGEFTNADTQYYTENIQGLEKYILAAKQGVTADMLTEAKDAYNYYNNKEDLSKSEMTTRFTSWVDNNQITEDWTDKQKDAVKSLLKYYNMNPVNTDRYERMGEYGVDPKNISAIESQLETLAKTEGFKDLTSSQQTYKKYDVILKEAATLSDDQALALVRSYGSLGPGAGKLKYMIQQYFGDRDEDFQETLYNSVRDERDWSHNWGRTKPDNPFD